MKKYSRLRADIDLDAVAYNFESMHRNLKPGTKMAAVIKADGYGHGAVQIARLITGYPYVWGFAVATAEEAMQLRRGGILKPIMLLGYAFEESYEDLIDYDIRACVFELESARKLSDAAGRLGKTIKVHVAVDTGMSRIGFADNIDSVEIIKEISRLPHLKIEGLFTHLARADEKDKAPAVIQAERYTAFATELAKRDIEIPIHHICNSAGIIRMREVNFDMVRAGITIYGLLPSEEVETDIVSLKPAMRLVSHISFIKALGAGVEISYGGTYKTVKPTRVATIPAGYADGYPRSLSGRGSVLIHGKRAPILGRICMDQFMVDVTDIPEARVLDETVLLGRQGKENISAEELGKLSGRFNYELVCDISKRVPRNYIRRGIVVEQVDYF